MPKSYNHSSAHVEWGPQGHQLIAGAADQLLYSSTKIKVNEILAPLKTVHLRDIATWADVIKGSDPTDPDTQKFIHDFKDRGRTWHFVDLPIEASCYDRKNYEKFTRDDDVVQTINKCIDILLEKNFVMSKLNALRWITHLVGDVHQPLHVGCGYIDERGTMPKLIYDPDTIQTLGLKDDHGGGFLFFTLDTKKEQNLHSYWDSMFGFNEGKDDLIDNIPLAKEQEEMINILIMEIKAKANKVSTNNDYKEKPINEWANIWATESLFKAREAHKSIIIEKKINNKKYMVSWEGQDNYEKRCLPIIREQITSATERLAKLLNTIFGN